MKKYILSMALVAALAFVPLVTHATTNAITSPLDGSTQSGVVTFTATYVDENGDGNDAVDWAIRTGACGPDTGTIYGNAFGTPFSWDGASFSATINMASDVPGSYCFIFNPVEDAGDANVRIRHTFVLEVNPNNTVTTVTGDTAAGENMPGWLFNRDANNATPIKFNRDAARIGEGSLYVLPLSGTEGARKFIGENFLGAFMADVNSISYDFLIGAGGNASDAHEFYMNVYANFGESDEDNYYDCRYDVVPTVGSTATFTTVTFDPTIAYPVTTRGTSPYACPAIPADMNLFGEDEEEDEEDYDEGATIRAFAINLGDTTLSDAGLDGYFDHVVVDLADGVETYDFEPFSASGEITSPAEGSTQSGIINFTANYVDEDGNDAVDWAIRPGICGPNVSTVYGNALGTPFNWNGASFSSVIDMTNDTPGPYCFIFNPVEDAGDPDIRLLRNFTLEEATSPMLPSSISECKSKGWKDFDFRNKKQCVRTVKTGKDMRLKDQCRKGGWRDLGYESKRQCFRSVLDERYTDR